MRITYEHELEELNKCLRDMAMMVEKAIEQTFVAFEDQNYTMAEDVIKGDRNVNDMERAIESRCLSLILRQQPVARDLRQISTALKVVTDLERIGDHAETIAKRVKSMNEDGISFSPEAAEEMKEIGDMVIRTTADALQALEDNDVNLAKTALARSHEVRKKEKAMRRSHVDRLNRGVCTPETGIVMLELLLNMKRVSDHAQNLCEIVLGEF